VARLEIGLDRELLGAIVSPPQTGRAQLTEFNFAHPLLRRALRSDEREEEIADQLAASSPLEDEIFSLAREAAADRLTPGTPDDKLRITVETVIGALPDLNRELVLGIRDPDAKKSNLKSAPLEPMVCAVCSRRWSLVRRGLSAITSPI
jgi:hypothetical protein